MSIKVNIPNFSQYYINGVRVVEVNGNTVGECLKHLVEQFPKLELFDKEGRLLTYLAIFVNRESAYPGGGLDRAVKDGDELSITSTIVGG